MEPADCSIGTGWSDHQSRVLRFHLAVLPGMSLQDFHRICSIYPQPKDLSRASFFDLVSSLGLNPGLAAEVCNLFENQSHSEPCMDVIDDLDIHLLFQDTENLPNRLATSKAKWHVLSCLGNIEALNLPKIIGIVGRRHATDEGMSLAYQLGYEMAQRGIGTLSGLAQGIDLAAHSGTLEGGGLTVGLVPMGLFRWFREKMNTNLTNLGGIPPNLTVISGCHPEKNWDRAEAMRRNLWIAAWSDALVVIEAGEKGGTWVTAQNAARFNKPLWIGSGFQHPETGVGNSILMKEFRGKHLDLSLPINTVVDKILEGLA